MAEAKEEDEEHHAASVCLDTVSTLRDAAKDLVLDAATRAASFI